VTSPTPSWSRGADQRTAISADRTTHQSSLASLFNLEPPRRPSPRETHRPRDRHPAARCPLSWSCSKSSCGRSNVVSASFAPPQRVRAAGYARFVAQGGDWGAIITDPAGEHGDFLGRSLSEKTLGFFDDKNVSVPAAVSGFPNELYQAPRSWAEQAYPSLIYYSEDDRGGHFVAWQEPQLFPQEVRAAFRALR
jgi:hypothetical protein